MPRPERLYRIEGVILRRHDLGETDRILTVYTRERGKIKVVAKGARKPSSRRAGYVELYLRIDALIATGQSLDILTQAEIVDAYLPLRQDLTRAMHAAHFGELVDAFTEEGDENRPLYRLLTDGLGWVCRTDDLRRTASYFEIHFLGVVGFRPELARCVICNEPLTARNQFFSTVEGGVVCPSCGQRRSGIRPLSLTALKVLRHMQRSPFDAIEQVRISPAVHNEVERLLHDILSYHLERRLKSAAFLARLRREAERRRRDRKGTADP